MIFFYAQDVYYYNIDEVEYLKKEYKINNIKFIYSKKELIKALKKYYKKRDIAVMSPFMIESFNLKNDDINLLTVKELKNRYGLLTTQDKEKNVDINVVLKNILKCKIHDSKLSMDDYGGKNNLKKEIDLIKLKQYLGLPIKGFFLSGIPGTGKSFLVKCVAGEFNAKLVELDLSGYLEYSNPIFYLNKFFEFFEEAEGKFIIWLDEIEKMLDSSDIKSKNIIGFLLTAINEFSQKSEKSDVMLMATANNLSDLAIAFPEFFRNGRFDYLIALEACDSDESFEVFNIHTKIVNDLKNKKISNIIYNLTYVDEFKTLIELYPKSFLYEILQEIKEKSLYIKKNDIHSYEAFEKMLNEELANDKANNLTLLVDKIKKFDIVIKHKTIETIARQTYREQLPKQNKFPYVNAEIEYLTGVSFLKILFEDKDFFDKNENVQELVNSCSPLQITFQDAIKKINSITKNFKKM